MFETLRPHITTILETNKQIDIKLQEVCNLLKEKIDHYDWVGFYFKDKTYF